jgi:hypothetical protein
MIGGMSGWFANPPLRPYLGILDKKEESRPSKKVFISYSHQDLEVTSKLRRKLESYGLRILIDVDALPPGKSIREFIAESISTSDATISIVSRHSLMSTWVALETIEALRHSEKKIFGCFVDKDFLKRGFVDEALGEATTQMQEIGELIKKRIDNQVSFEDLYRDWTDYLRLRSSVDTIVGRLRDSACLSLDQEVFEESCKKLAKALGQLNE